MAVELVSEIWNEVKRYISAVDRSEVAEIIVSVLVDHDYDADDIRVGFRGDSDVKAALSSYLKDHADEVEDDDDDEYDDDYDEDEDDNY